MSRRIEMKSQGEMSPLLEFASASSVSSTVALSDGSALPTSAEVEPI
ncbi:MAG: hypothetical protein AAGN15_11375 [Cyanobacteria bacterium J06581_3]